ncbi:hypothetical protein E2C01_011065 [Portunus trituberculatus]|uniref:Uncharacterized protein n=1 Tax=Portunus trituberculatus TaxID=210409 RepID=A0A5B7DA40_PORTR|nr:hypothetical protein [Portunus trituberculatus]
MCCSSFLQLGCFPQDTFTDILTLNFHKNGSFPIGVADVLSKPAIITDSRVLADLQTFFNFSVAPRLLRNAKNHQFGLSFTSIHHLQELLLHNNTEDKFIRNVRGSVGETEYELKRRIRRASKKRRDY